MIAAPQPLYSHEGGVSRTEGQARKARELNLLAPVSPTGDWTPKRLLKSTTPIVHWLIRSMDSSWAVAAGQTRLGDWIRVYRCSDRGVYRVGVDEVWHLPNCLSIEEGLRRWVAADRPGYTPPPTSDNP